MNLKERTNEDLKAALKSGSNDVVSTLRFLSSVIKNKELEKRTKLSKEGKLVAELEQLSALNDDETINIILGEIKKRKESIAQYEKYGREDLAKKETAELEILKKYVPEEMPEEELRSLIKRKITEMGKVTIKEFGKLMGAVMAEAKGRADGTVVKKIIEEELK
ncbi:MAG: GatB/YqeY domain-containing protein [Patescibacteria group bacterium]